MSKKKWPWIAVDVSEALDEEGLWLLLRQCDNGVPEIEFLYDNEFDAQAEAAKRNAEEEKQQHEAAQQDMIHHPGHYNFRGMECKDFIEKFVSDPKSYYEGNIFKYLYRYLEKNKEEDLNKAMEYTRMLKEYLYGKDGKEE